MGVIRNLPSEILVMFEPDEILSETIGFTADTVSKIGSAIIFAAQAKLIGTSLEKQYTDVVTVEFKDGKYVVTMGKKKGI